MSSECVQHHKLLIQQSVFVSMTESIISSTDEVTSNQVQVDKECK